MSLFRRIQIRVKAKLCKNKQLQEQPKEHSCPWNNPDAVYEGTISCEKECPIYKKTCYRWDLCIRAREQLRKEFLR